ncbi:MAG: aa3-type cytochrome c oxidase subunit IV [Sphingomonadales bacterium]|nr:aa3-type cytochrome c oxidase subunit IV [Sphingomonadales bacterium]
MASEMDMKAARSTYEGFIGLIKFAAPVIALVVILVLYLITR